MKTKIVKTEVTDKVIAEALNQKWSDAKESLQDAVKKALVFGATFAAAELELEHRGTLKRGKYAGQGMNAWLAENCPAINYKTAQRWKSLALGAAAKMGVDKASALLLLQGRDDELVEEMPENALVRRDEVFAAPSLAKLQQAVFDFASETRGQVGRPVGSGHEPQKPRSQAESAQLFWASFIAPIVKTRQAYYSSTKLLTLDQAKTALEELDMLCRALKDRIQEGK